MRMEIGVPTDPRDKGIISSKEMHFRLVFQSINGRGKIGMSSYEEMRRGIPLLVGEYFSEAKVALWARNYG